MLQRRLSGCKRHWRLGADVAAPASVCADSAMCMAAKEVWTKMDSSIDYLARRFGADFLRDDSFCRSAVRITY